VAGSGRTGCEFVCLFVFVINKCVQGSMHGWVFCIYCTQAKNDPFVHQQSNKQTNKETNKQTHSLSFPKQTNYQDEKVLACWTALAITGLTKAGTALQAPEYLEAAEEAAAFIRRVMYDEGAL
jgi:uncharacterized protein YyaL (SSP411 family)